MTLAASGTDDLSGIGSVVVWFDRPMATTSGNLEGLFSGFEDGSASRQITFPQYFAPGRYNVVRVVISDNARNARTYLPDELRENGMPTGLDVVLGLISQDGFE